LRCVHCGSEGVYPNGRCGVCHKLASGKPEVTGVQAPSQAAASGCVSLLMLIGLIALVAHCNSSSTPTPQQTQADQAKAEQDRKQGLHCLSGWDGSNRSLVDEVKRQLRGPDSFEHIETDIQPEVNGKHSITMEYRARNGFGGMDVATAEGVVDHDTCEATLISTGD